jgi:hypothetical protein
MRDGLPGILAPCRTLSSLRGLGLLMMNGTGFLHGTLSGSRRGEGIVRIEKRRWQTVIVPNYNCDSQDRHRDLILG